MIKRECPCGTPTRDRYLCYGCDHRLQGYLTDLEWLNGELHTALTRMVRMTERGEGGRSAETALVFNQTAAERIRLNRATLAAWAKLIADDTAAPRPVNNATRVLVDWLTHQLPEMITHREDVTAFLDEIRNCRNESQRIVDLPVNRSTFEAGPCPEDVEDHPCDGIVWAVIPRDPDKRPRLECRGCRSVWYAEQWERTGRRIVARAGKVSALNTRAVQELLTRIA